MAKMRWGEEGPKDDEAARRRLIDSAEKCFKRYGVAKTTVEDVAMQANVSRATVYRYFEGRDELVLGVLLREAGRFVKRLRKHIDLQPTFSDAIVEGAVFTLENVRGDANLGMLFAPETVGLTARVEGASEALFAISSEIMLPIFELGSKEGKLREGIDLADASEWMMRVIISLLVVEVPFERNAEELRTFLRNFLLPALVASPPEPALSSGRLKTQVGAG